MTNHAIPTGWKQAYLKTLFDFKNGVNATKKDYGDGIPFINVMEIINNNALKLNDIPGKVKLSEKQIEENKVIKGDVLFNRTSETKEEIALSAVYLDDMPVVFGGFVIRGRAKNSELTNKFKKYCFRSTNFRSRLIKAGQGAVRANIGQKDLDKIFIIYPIINEQNRIVAALETWDQAIESVKKKIEVKKRVKKGLMQKLLTGQVRLPGFSEPWVITKLGKITKNISKRNSELQIERVLSVTNTKGFVLPEEQFSKTVASKDLSNYKIVEKENYAYNPSRINVGSIARLQRFDNGVLSPMYVIFSLDQTQVNTDFFYDWLFIDRTKASIKNAASGSVRESVDYKSFASIEIKLPKIEEQTVIANILTTTDKEIETLKKKLRLLEDQKKYLLNNLITGKIRAPENNQ